MKNILKYTLASVAAFAALTACQEFEDYDKTIGGAPNLVYASTGEDNVYKIKVVHKPIGSEGQFSTRFGINCNSTRHAAVKVALVYDASLVEAYNAEHETSYAVLPAEYLALENETLTLEKDAKISSDSVTVTLQGDLTRLTERGYLAPLRLKPQGIDASEVKGAVYVLVDTEKNIIRPISSTDEMVGFPATGRTRWTADCAGFTSLFDGNASTRVEFSESGTTSLTIDMKEPQKVTGLQLGYQYGVPRSVSIEYSADGETFEQAGTPVSGEYATDNSTMYVAFYGNVEAQYLRLTIDFTGSYYAQLSEINIYKVDSDDPNIFTVIGSENLIAGKVVHKGANSTSNIDASFSVSTTVASQSGYSVQVALDNSLVDAYNEANGTSYKALPSQYLQLTGVPVSIAANATKSEAEVNVKLQGDLSQLADKAGYLAPLKLSASGAASSKSRGVVYVVVNVENNLIRPITSGSQIIGFPVSGRNNWSADCDNYANLFDGDNGSNVGFDAAPNVLTIDMKDTHLITGLYFRTYRFSSISIEYSVDGTVYESAGTPESSEWVKPGSSWSAGDAYIAFIGYLQARYLRLTLDFSGSYAPYYTTIAEIQPYEIESEDPTLYAMCGTDNVMTGSIAHTPGGAFNGVNAAFNVYTTIASASGYSVSVDIDESLVATYNRAHNTSYKTLPAANVSIENTPLQIAANENVSADQVKVSLTGDLASFTDKNGYLIPLKLSAPGAVSSASRGTVYVVVMPVEELFRKNFVEADIEGSRVADRSGWTIIECDDSGVYPDGDGSQYNNLFDDDTKTYIRTWGGPVDFKVDLGQEYEMTGIVITARTDNSSYQRYQPHTVLIETSEDGATWTELGTVTSSNGDLVAANPSSFAALYGSKTVRYLHIQASYGSNMGCGDFNIFVK